MHYPHTATIQSLTKSNGQSIYGNSSATKCFLQPLDAEFANTIGITFSKAFACYVPYSTVVKEKHRLVIDGETYGVAGIQPRGYGNLAHKRLILEKM